MTGNWDVFGVHVLAVAIVFAYSFVVSLGLYWVTDKMMTMRVSYKSEKIGLDIRQHDEQYNFADTESVEIEEELAEIRRRLDEIEK